MLQRLVISLLFFMMPVSALALDFRSVGIPKAVLYDAPSASATKSFIVYQFYPVEVIVKLPQWNKVRDSEGGVFWIEANALSSERTVLVKADVAYVYASPEANSKVIASVEKQVVLLLADPTIKNGFVKVQSTQGLSGYMPLSTLWGIY